MNDLVQAIASKEAEGSLAPEERKLFKKVYKKRVKGWNNFFDKWASHNPEDDQEYEVDEVEDWKYGQEESDDEEIEAVEVA